MPVVWLGNEVALCQCFQELVVLEKTPLLLLKAWKGPGKDFAASALKTERTFLCSTHTREVKRIIIQQALPVLLGWVNYTGA